jgi:hypothetical protein
LLFVKWYRPISEETKTEALIEAFRNPPLYADLIEAFEGNILPPLKPLANILFQRHSISDSASDKAADIFIQNAELIGVLDSDRNLSFGVAKKELKDDVIEEIAEEDIYGENDNYTPTIIPQKEKEDGNSKFERQDSYQQYLHNKPSPHNIPLKDKMPAQLLLPHDVASADFDFIIAYIGLIRQQYT